VTASVVIGSHLLAVTVAVVAAPSGPWPAPEGASLATPPQFAYSMHRDVTASYVQALKLQHNAHFAGNRPGVPGAWFEARLKDDKGREIATVRVPDPAANAWLYHQQACLAGRLADDEPVPPPQSEVIAAPNQEVPTVGIWDIAGNRKLKLARVPIHLVPRDRPVFRPSEYSLVLARSYARHLCRVYDAATAEIIRHTQDPLPPAVLAADGPPEAAFGELVSNFGELPR
jgi:hypothetical protein